METRENPAQNGYVDISGVLRNRRAELAMSQTDLANATGISLRQIARYESGEQTPTLEGAVQIAEALNISLAQLAGQTGGPDGLDLGGQWFAGWQNSRDGKPWVAVQQVEIHQHGYHLQVAATRSRPVEEGGYSWTGELRLWDGEALMGWYRASDGAVRSKGTMYFALHPQGTHAIGRWVGLSYDGTPVTGHASLARDRLKAEQLLHDAIDKEPNGR